MKLGQKNERRKWRPIFNDRWCNPQWKCNNLKYLYIANNFVNIHKGRTTGTIKRNRNTLEVGDLNSSLLDSNRSSGLKISEDIQVHPEKRHSSYFSNAHGAFTQTDHILSHKENLNKF